MKTHTTNYSNTFIEIAEDCPVDEGAVPPVKGDKKSVANLQFEMVIDEPYQHTSDDVIYTVFARRNDVTESEWEEQRKAFFSKGQPCLRASPLTKTYGWGVHSDANGKVALYAAGTPEYERFLADDAVVKVKAMRSKKA